MANLSNINNKFLFTDGDFLKIGNLAPINNISGTESGLSITNSNVASIALDNTAANGKTYVMYSDDGGKLNFYDVDASSGRLIIDSSGNSTFAGQVSVGNYAIPSDHQFQIAHLGQAYARFALTNSQTGNGSSDGLIFQMENLNSIIKNQENGFLAFGTNGRETDLRIDSSGNVGINYTGPFNQISGTETTLAISNSNIPSLYLNNSSTNGHNYILLSGTDGAFAIYDKTVGANRFIIDSSGAITTDVTGEVTIPFYIDGYRTGVQQVWLNNSRAANSSNGRGTKLILGAGNTVGAYFTHYTSGSTGNGVLDIGVQYTGVTTQSGLEFNTNSNRTVLKSVGGSGYTSFESSDGSERMRINNSGDVGIGTTPETAGPTWRTLFIGASATIVSRQAASGYDSIFANNYYVNSSNQDRVRTTGPSSRMFLDGNNIRFQISPSSSSAPSWSEIMRITSGGDVEITGGYASSQTFQSTGSLRVSSNSTTTSGNVALELMNDATGTRYLATFTNLNGRVGSISTYSSSTSYNTSSDYRLKENVVEMTGALDRVSQLKPSRFNFIADADKTVDGFLAHEVQEIVPEAITGEKDAVDEEGNPDYQGIDQSKLVPLLVGAIQELKAEIDELKK